MWSPEFSWHVVWVERSTWKVTRPSWMCCSAMLKRLLPAEGTGTDAPW
jgi:hypothetical protein